MDNSIWKARLKGKVSKKKEKGQKHPKHLGKVRSDDYGVNRMGQISIKRMSLLKQKQIEKNTPKRMILKRDYDPGFFFGSQNQEHYVGISQGEEGNIVIIGGSGSGKSAGVAKPTLRMWKGAICATDIKGELSDFYANMSEKMFQQGIIARPYIIFDPTQIDGPSYDPFW